LRILIDNAIINYITELEHSEISIFRNTAVSHITKYQIHVPGLCNWAVGRKECFSDDKIKKQEMPSKYVMKIYSKRYSIPRGITNWKALREWECGCAVHYCANLTQFNLTPDIIQSYQTAPPGVTLGCPVDYCANLT
jgi:hypothetical protein